MRTCELRERTTPAELAGYAAVSPLAGRFRHTWTSPVILVHSKLTTMTEPTSGSAFAHGTFRRSIDSHASHMHFSNRKSPRPAHAFTLLPLVISVGSACSSSGSDDQTAMEVTSAPTESSSTSVPGVGPSAPSTLDSSPAGAPSVAPPVVTGSPSGEQPAQTTPVASGPGPSASSSSPTGGTASDGSASGGAPAGGTGAGGTGGSAGGTGAGGSGGMSSGGTAAGGSGGMSSGGGSNGDVVPSAGCNVADGPDSLTVGGSSVSNGLPTSTKLSINTGGMNREYIVDIPANYDPTHPYRLIFSWHQAYGSADGNANGLYPANNGPNFDAEHYAFFGLHRVATEANDPVIFVAPQGIGNFPWDYDRDVALFDDVLALVTDKLCIDESRVFTTGFSFGAMMSHALSIGRASKLRGAVTMAAANYNFTQPTNDHTPIAYFGITGMSDGTCPWVNSDQGKTGGKYCVLSHAEDNGCTVPGDIQTAAGGSNNHVCFDFEGCSEGYPVKVCTFDGNHTPSSVSDGSPGDDGLKAFVPPLAWEFISQL